MSMILCLCYLQYLFVAKADDVETSECLKSLPNVKYELFSPPSFDWLEFHQIYSKRLFSYVYVVAFC